MSDDPLDLLIDDYLDGRLSDAHCEQLEAELLSSSSKLDRLVAAATLHRHLQNRFVAESQEGLHDLIGATAAIEIEATDQAVFGMVINQALATRRQHEIEEDANTRLAVQQAEEKRRTRYELLRQEFEPVRRVIVIPKAAIWIGLAAVLGLAVLLISQLNSTNPTPHGSPPVAEVVPDVGPSSMPVVATLIRTLDGRWDNDAPAWDDGPGLRQGLHRLVEGLVEIELTDGVRVVLEAPVSFDLTGANRMTLVDGRLVATVPPAAIGFTIDTETARIIDYGTEFGVYADGESQTHVQVFRGEVRAAVRTQGQVVGEPVSLLQSQAATIDAGGAVVEQVAFDDSAFERRVVKRLDLVDIVAGGDGTGAARMRAINPSTGRATSRGILDYRAAHLPSSGQYHSVDTNPLIDGVFIPHQRDGVQVDSTGTTVSGLAVSDPRSYQLIWAGGLMPSAGAEDALRKDIALAYPGKSDVAPVLYMISNKGITIDLDAVRTSVGDEGAIRFRAELQNIGKSGRGASIERSADVYCFLDGERVDEYVGIHSGASRLVLDVLAKTEQRFLTVVVVDGDNGLGNDWVVLHRPTLEIGIAAMGTEDGVP